MRSTRQRDSPCLLVKGTDCAGDVRFQDVVIDRSSIELRASMLPHMKMAPPVPENDGELGASRYRGEASGYLLVIATRASDSKWSGSMQETMSLTNGGSLLFLYHSARASSAASASANASNETRYFPSRL